MDENEDGTGGEDTFDGKPLHEHPRFQQVVEQKRGFKERAENAERELATARQALEESGNWKTKFEQLQADHTKAQAEWTSERAMLEHGLVDAEAREVAGYFYGKLPEEGRPDLGAWLGEIKSDPSKAPRALTPYLGAPAGGEGGNASTDTGGGDTGGTELPDSTRGVETGARAGGGTLSAAKIRELREEAQRTGDWSKYREARPQILESIRQRQ